VATSKAVSAAPAPKLTKKEISANNYIGLVAVLVLVILVVAAFVGNLLIHSIITNTKVIKGNQRAVSDLNVKLEHAPQLVSAYNRLGTQRTTIENALPEKPDFEQLISIMETMGTAAGVQIKSVSPQPNASSGGSGATTSSPASTPSSTTGSSAKSSSTTAAAPVVTTTPYIFTATVIGGYPNIVAMLRNVELSARPMRVTSIDFKGTGSSLNANITLTTYFQGKADIKDKEEEVK
jgi:hypothetical protein